MIRLYLRDAVRSLLRRRGFAISVLLTLALAIGANVVVFALVNAVVLQPLPYARPESLLWIWHSRAGGGRFPFSIPDYVEYQRGNTAFEGLAAFRIWNANLTGAIEAERVTGIRVSENFFDILDVPAAKRLFTASDRDPKLAILSHGLWERRFGGDKSVVGRSLLLNGEPHLVVGVLPHRFIFPLPEAEFAVPLAIDLDPNRNEPAVSTLRMVGRLKTGMTAGQAETELEQSTARLRSLYPQDNADKRGVNLVPLHEQIVGNHRGLLFLLGGAVRVVLLPPCTNLGSLFRTLACARRREFAIRLTLGAGRRRIFTQLLIERLILATAGGLLGIAFASTAIDGFLRLAPTEIPRARDAAVDSTVLVFSLGLSSLSGILFGFVPALQAARSDPHPVLHGETRSATGGTSARSRAHLLAAQTALAVILAVGAGLFLRSFERLVSVAPGLDPEGLLTARLALPQNRYNDAAAINRFVDTLTERTAALPSVRAAAAVSVLPLSGYMSVADFAIEGRPAPPPGDEPFAHYRMVTPGYFRTMGIPVLRGREFTSFDRLDSERVVIINQSMEQRYWFGNSAIGAAVAVDDGNGSTRRLRVVGVVANVRHLGLDHPIENDLYIALPQIPPVDVTFLGNLYLVVRSDRDPRILASAIRDQVAAVDRDVAASQLRTMDEVLALAVAPRRFSVTLLSGFALAALLLVGLGVYAVTNQLTIQRQREIGIRLAVGARPVDVVRLVTIQTLRPAFVGVTVGIAIAMSSSQVVRSLLYGISAMDAWALAAGSTTVVAISWLATLLPAMRAARIQPSGTLSDR